MGIRSDNIAALSLLCKMSARSKPLGIIARELALDIAHACYVPEVVEHIPGISNIPADSLSRKFDPEHASFTIPAILANIEPDVISPRGSKWWRSLDSTPAAAIMADKGC